MGKVFASADIGSNTAHLLVAEIGAAGMRRIHNASMWLSLGEIVGREGSIPVRVVDQLIDAVGSFKATAGQAKAGVLYAFATEAMRAAENRDEVLRRIETRTGVRVELISGRREAELGLKGALLDCAGSGTGVFVEVGGGSAQVARFENSLIEFEASLPLGTGRLSAEFALSQPVNPKAADRLQEHVVATATRHQADYLGAKRMVASGGVARGLWRALHPDGNRTLRLPELEYAAWATERLDVATICARFNVKPRRAATLFPGACVLHAMMSAFGHAEVLVSEFGVREGAILEMAEGKVSACRV